MLALLPGISLHGSMQLGLSARSIERGQLVPPMMAIVCNTYQQYGSADAPQLDAGAADPFDLQTHILPFVDIFAEIYKLLPPTATRQSCSTFFGTNAHVYTSQPASHLFFAVNEHDRDVLCGPPIVYHIAAAILAISVLPDEVKSVLKTCTQNLPFYKDFDIQLPDLTRILKTTPTLLPGAYSASLALNQENILAHKPVYVHHEDMLKLKMSVTVDGSIKLPMVNAFGRPPALTELRYIADHGHA